MSYEFKVNLVLKDVRFSSSADWTLPLGESSETPWLGLATQFLASHSLDSQGN